MSLKRFVDPRRWPAPLAFLVAIVVVVFLSGAIVSLATHLMGSRDAFAAAKQAALPWLFMWRWACYIALIVSWLCLWKPRVIKRLNKDADGGDAARDRLKRLEYLGIGVPACIEVYNVIDWLGGDS